MTKLLVIVIGSICVLGIAGAALWMTTQNSGSSSASTKQSQTVTATKTTNPTPAPAPTTTFNKQAHSTTDATSLWAIVNKQHPISPANYVPADIRKPDVTLRVPGATEMELRDEAATAAEKLFAAASAAGYNLQVSTAYRGYAYQKTLYDSYVAKSGQAAADTFSARPGYSEHQTGWALDIRTTDNTCPLETCFGDLPAGKWLAANAHTYGFILRYPADKTSVTGYQYEPWHFRYLGTDLAAEMHAQGIETMEEFFGVSGGTSY